MIVRHNFACSLPDGIAADKRGAGVVERPAGSKGARTAAQRGLALNSHLGSALPGAPALAVAAGRSSRACGARCLLVFLFFCCTRVPKTAMNAPAPVPVPVPVPAPPPLSSAAPAGPAAQPPRSVALPGYGGLLPFGALALLLWLDGARGALWWPALLAYGAVILSFVGALHWGFALALPTLGTAQRQGLYIWSVVPALVAWPALLWGAPGAGVLLVAGFVLHWLQDRRLVACTGAALPAWYLLLRTRLTLVASACLLAGAGARLAHAAG